MTFQLDEMLELGRPVARVVVAVTQGSVPREVGASLLVWDGGVSGTIGGGALEYQAIANARKCLDNGNTRFDRLPLGPGLGQCCGGAVGLLTEVWEPQALADLDGVVARKVDGHSTPMPLSVKRVLSAARQHGDVPDPQLLDGWMIEAVSRPQSELWVWGAGHVGRALIGVLAPLPDFKLRWADTDRARFPDRIPANVESLIAENPGDLVTLAAPDSLHFVMTFSHALDLDICHRVLGQSFGFLGLIGSSTKRARFRKRLAALGHSSAQIDRIQCPIGDPLLGKQPQAIALGVAGEVIRMRRLGVGSMKVLA
ncbi:MAG: xanthine dehydrogenase accessory protein XdhC [Pseudomonadota bacterium]